MIADVVGDGEQFEGREWSEDNIHAVALDHFLRLGLGAGRIAAANAVNEESEVCHELENCAGYLRAGGSRVNFRFLTSVTDNELEPSAFLNFMSRVLDVSKVKMEETAKAFPPEIKNAIAAKTVTRAGGARRPSLASDAIAALADGLDHRRVTELGAQPVDGGFDGRGERVGGLVPHPFEQFLR